MKIIKTPENSISITDMKDGEIGQIVGWPIPQHIGNIVQRSGNYLFSLGVANEYWTGLFAFPIKKIDMQIVILPKGTQIEI